MASTTGGGWAQLRQQARSLETQVCSPFVFCFFTDHQTETLFHTYSQYASMTNIPPKQTDEEKKTESQLQDILQKRDALITQLTRLLDSTPDLAASSLKQSNLTRHRELVQEHRRTFSQLKSSIGTARDKANLLSNVRSDISAYRASNPENAEAEYMLDERRRIDNSHNVIDGVLAQAYATQDSFRVQRETLANIQRRITTAATSIPGINNLIGRIGTKKRRDGIILGVFIAFCFLLFLYFW